MGGYAISNYWSGGDGGMRIMAGNNEGGEEGNLLRRRLSGVDVILNGESSLLLF